MSALNSPIDLAALFDAAAVSVNTRGSNVIYPDDANATYPVDQTFYYNPPYTGVYADFAPRLDGDSAGALDSILRLLFRTNRFHVKVHYHGIETTYGSGPPTTGPAIPYTWEDDLVYQPSLPGHSEADCYVSGCYPNFVARRNATATPGVADNGGDFSGDGFTYLTLALAANGAAGKGDLGLFLTFGLQCYPLVINPYGGTNGAMFVESVGNLSTPAQSLNSIMLAGQMFNACSLGCACVPASQPDGLQKLYNMYFDSLEITDTGSWSWDGIYGS